MTPEKLVERQVGVEWATIEKAAKWLSYYGYLRGAVESLLRDPVGFISHVAAAVADMQERAGLKVSGTLCKETVEVMNRPRCGCTDVQRIGAEEAKWRKDRLTYRVTDYVGGMTNADQDDLLRLAWNDWEAAADVKLTQVASTTSADITISTGRGRGANFDGPSGTLAWAYLPSGNDQPLLMRFDLDETWVMSLSSGQRGILLRNVACHEFGHLLGLDHSRTSTALMAPYYNPSIPSPVQNDDVVRIRALYGPAKEQPTNPQPQPPAGGTKTVVEFVGDLRQLSVNGRTVLLN